MPAEGDDGPLKEDQALLDRIAAHATTSQAPAHEPWWSTHSAMTMCSAVLIFGILVMALSTVLALKKLEKDTILKVVVIPMAVVSAIFLVVAGYDDRQVAPAMGLLGTIVGYVLGTARKDPAQDDQKGGRTDIS
jgi:hypothetical protein